MADVDYRVEAELFIKGIGQQTALMKRIATSAADLHTGLGKSSNDIRKMVKRLEKLDEGFSDTNKKVRKMAKNMTWSSFKGSLFAHIVRDLINFSLRVTVDLIQAIARGLTNAIAKAVQFHKQMEGARIGISTAVAETHKIDFSRAMQVSKGVFRLLQDAAVEGVGETKDLVATFKLIVGPISAAGRSLRDVVTITKGGITAAASLGVDFAQASRDMGLMVTGAAGLDTKLFRILGSLGLITKDTKKWNQTFTTAQRIAKLEAALTSDTIKAAAKAYEKSFEGVTSTMSDLRSTLGESLMGPVLRQVAVGIKRINDALIGMRGTIELAFGVVGTNVGTALSDMFDRVFESMSRILKGLPALMPAFARGADTILDWVSRMGPALEHTAIFALALGAAISEMTSDMETAARRIAYVGLLVLKAIPGVGLFTPWPDFATNAPKAKSTPLADALRDLRGVGADPLAGLAALGLMSPASDPYLDKAPDKRGKKVFDFRGSNFHIKQDFKKSDPGAVAIVMRDAFSKLAEQRVQTGFVPAFTR